MHVFPAPPLPPSHDGKEFPSAGLGGLVRASSLLTRPSPPPQSLLLSWETRDRLRLLTDRTAPPSSRESLQVLPRSSVGGDTAAPDASSVTS